MPRQRRGKIVLAIFCKLCYDIYEKGHRRTVTLSCCIEITPSQLWRVGRGNFFLRNYAYLFRIPRTRAMIATTSVQNKYSSSCVTIGHHPLRLIFQRKLSKRGLPSAVFGVPGLAAKSILAYTVEKCKVNFSAP